MDLTPLRSSRDFRLLFTSRAVTYLGSMMTMVAIPFQVAELSGSYVAVGVIGLVEVVPLVVFGLYGGALADRLDRRTMAVATELAALLLSGALAVNALLPTPHLWLIYIVAMLFAAVSGLQRPSIEAILPRVVAHEQLAAAGVLTSAASTVGAIASPAIAGLILTGNGAAAVYIIDGITFAVSMVLLWRLSMNRASEASSGAATAIVEGLRYAWSRRDILGTYAIDMSAMVFAFPYALFPFIADTLESPQALGLLYAAPAAGALLVTLTSGWIPRVHRHGRAIAMAAACWGLAIGGLAMSSSITWAIVMLVLAGVADMISGQFRMLMWNQTIPDDMRGRLAGIEMLSYSIGPMTGQMTMSGIAAISSLRAALAIGSLACMGSVAVVAASIRSLWNFDDRTNPQAVAERQRRRMEAENPH